MEKKDFEKDGLDNQPIIETIKKIRKVVEVKCDDSIIDNLKKEHAFFLDRYPILFDMSIRTNEPFNWDYLNYFLNMRTKIINNELTSEKASVIIGNEWFKKHVNINENINENIDEKGNVNDDVIKKNKLLNEEPKKFNRKSK
jgi:hypothetical protein